MKRDTLMLIAVGLIVGGVVFRSGAFRSASQEDAPIFVAEMPAGYRPRMLAENPEVTA